MTDMIKKSEDEDRRKFLETCGRFAIVTPPAITLLLSTSLSSTAIARSGGTNDRDGHYRGSGDGYRDYHHDDDHDHHDDHHGDGWRYRGERD
jgi:hypothetical protein